MVVLPEAFLTGYDAGVFSGRLPTPDDLAGGVLDPLREAAAACGTTVVASAALLSPHGRTLSSVVVEPDGTRDSELRVGAPYFREAGVEHDVVNANDHDFTFIEIEVRS